MRDAPRKTGIRARTCPSALRGKDGTVYRCDRIYGHQSLGQDGLWHRTYSRPDWLHVIVSWTGHHPNHVAYLPQGKTDG
jgi:hypothetical protein